MYKHYLIPTESVEIGGLWKCLNTVKPSDKVGGLVIGIAKYIHTKADARGNFEPQHLYLTTVKTGCVPVQGRYYISECNNTELSHKPFCYLCDSPDLVDCVVIEINGEKTTTTKSIFSTASEVLFSNDGSDDISQIKPEYISRYVEYYNSKNIPVDNLQPLLLSYDNQMLSELKTDGYKAAMNYEYGNVQAGNVHDYNEDYRSDYPKLNMGEGFKAFIQPYLVKLIHEVADRVEDKRDFDIRDWMDENF